MARPRVDPTIADLQRVVQNPQSTTHRAIARDCQLVVGTRAEASNLAALSPMLYTSASDYHDCRLLTGLLELHVVETRGRAAAELARSAD